MPRTLSTGPEIDYTDLGRGEPALLLLSGWCATREAYGRMNELCAQHRVRVQKSDTFEQSTCQPMGFPPKMPQKLHQ